MMEQKKKQKKALVPRKIMTMEGPGAGYRSVRGMFRPRHEQERVDIEPGIEECDEKVADPVEGKLREPKSVNHN